jgi:hypothetical protein
MFVGLNNFLINEAAIKALIGTPGTRSDKTTGVFPQQASVDEPTLPFIAYSQVFGSGEAVLEGVDRLRYGRYRLACWGSTYLQAKTLANTVRLRLDGLRGTLSNNDVLESSTYRAEADTTDDLPHGTCFGTHVDFDFAWEDHSDGH